MMLSMMIFFIMTLSNEIPHNDTQHMTCSIMTFSIMTFSIMIFSITAFSIMALRITIMHDYAEFQLYSMSFMLSVTYKPFMPSVITLKLLG